MNARPGMRRLYGFLLAGACMLCPLAAADAEAGAADAPPALLEVADSIKTSDHGTFAKLLLQMEPEASKLSPQQQWHLRYLKAWDVAYYGDYERAGPLLDEVIAQDVDATLRFRATATSINILGIGHRYEEAFTRLDKLTSQLPQITDKRARLQGLGEAAQLLVAAGQYDLAAQYADEMLKNLPPGEGPCKGLFFKAESAYRSEKPNAREQLDQAIDRCVSVGETVYANTLRAELAVADLERGEATQAIAVLTRNYADVQHDGYQTLIAQFDAALAKAHLSLGNLAEARKHALAAVQNSIKGEYTAPLGMAYQVLYRVARKQGDLAAALAYLEQYMAADKGYLDDVSAKALAYQVVKQQVLSGRLQLDTLNKQNQILQLQQALDRKAVEASRLYIVLLLMALGFITLWIYRLKRSQLRFMWLSRLDSLTGICNRKHFIEEAETALQAAAKTRQPAALVILDLDHFKSINDTFGHAVGDHTLKHIVEACRPLLSAREVFGRLGGEEFAVLLPDCTPEQALARAEQLRAAIGALSPLESGELSVSASLGVADTHSAGYDVSELLVRADHALYRAKSEGRNRVVATWMGAAVTRVVAGASASV